MKVKYLPTVKRIVDALWDEARLLILPLEKPNSTTGHSAVPFTKVLDSILHVLRN